MTQVMGVRTDVTGAYYDLIAGPVETQTVSLKIGATPTIGQLYVYDASTQSYADFSAFSAGNILCIMADQVLNDPDGVVLTAAENCTVIVKGYVRLSKLDATAQADVDIVAALQENGIIAVRDIAN